MSIIRQSIRKQGFGDTNQYLIQAIMTQLMTSSEKPELCSFCMIVDHGAAFQSLV